DFLLWFNFFFSSRRRHTRSDRDWSSDVCSSDLRRQGGESSSYEFGKCRLDLSAHKLFRNGTEIELTAKEFKLLEFFVNRAGRALTRDSILDGVWGDEVIVTGRSVDRCVTTLRSKIEADPRNPLFIQTIRDIGYRFEFSA